jgi:ElaA protein
MIIKWKYKNFNQLTAYELYDGLQLRSEVFVVEQQCVFPDMDNIDQRCFHLFGYKENKLFAYARIVPPGIIYKEPSIGRVVTSPLVRKNGIGKQLMQQAIATTKELYGDVSIKIGAQFYLKNFYESFGFYQIGNVYLEDGIEHIQMLKNAIT